MEYAIILYFDENSEKLIRELRSNLCREGINSHTIDIPIKPHITLASFKTENGTDTISEICTFAESQC